MIYGVKRSPIALLALALLPIGEQFPHYELPPGPAAELVERCASAVPRGATFRSWPQGLDSVGWERVEPWVEWAKLVRAEADSEFPKALRRAELARAAIASGRSTAAWKHFENCASDPSVAAALLPYLFPGVPLEMPPGTSLPDGVTLRPLLPPPSEYDLPYGSFDPASLSVSDLQVGAAFLALKLDLARDGVQIDVTHLSGAATQLSLVMARPEGYYTKTEFLDWERLEDRPAARTIRCSADSETETEHSYWGRFAPLPLRWPGIHNVAPQPLLARLRDCGIEIRAAKGLESRACGLAFAIEEVFGIPTSESSLRFSGKHVPIPPLVLRLSEESGLDGLRVAMGLIEKLAFE